MSNLLTQYNFEKYSDFAAEVKQKLSNIFKQQKEPYSIYDITARAKSKESLEQKISKNNFDTLTSIKDLAGCRIIFFYNHDIQRFNNSNIISDNFELIEQPKYHNRTSDIAVNSNELYTAIHYLVKLKKFDTLSLGICKNLRCEIQIHTLLNHAFSETTHNITYKKPQNLIIGDEVLKEIDDEFKNLAEKYLFPAGYCLSNVVSKYQKLIQANNLANSIIQDIHDTSCSFELTNVLDKWKQNVANKYNDYQTIHDISVEIINLTIARWKDYNRYSSADILLSKIIEILVYVMPLDVNFFFSEIVELYQNSIEKSIIWQESKHLLVHITKYSEQSSNYEKQACVLDFISKLADKVLIKIIDLVCLLCKEILQFEIMCDDFIANIDYVEPSKSREAVQLKQTGVPASNEVKKLRSNAISLLLKLYVIDGITAQQKEDLILVLSNASNLPRNTSYKSSVSQTVVLNLKTIIQFYIKILPKESYAFCKLAYNQVFTFRQVAWQLERKEDTKAISQEFLSLSEIFKNKLYKKNDFEIYDDLLSLGTVDYVKNLWDTQLEIQCVAESEVISIMQGYGNTINARTKKKWEKIILESIKILSDSNKYPIRIFFIAVATMKPLFIINLIRSYEVELKDYFSSIFVGLLRSHKKAIAEELLQTWIIQSKHLECIVKIYELNSFLLGLIYEKARNTSNFELLTQILEFIADTKTDKPLILPIIDIFTNARKPIDQGRLYILINELGDLHLDKILNNLLFIKKVDGHYLYYIEIIAIRKPAIIIPFFKQLFTQCLVYKWQTAYDIGECLLNEADGIVDSFLNSFSVSDHNLFTFLFPIKNKKIQSFLANLVNANDVNKVTFLVHLLDGYEERGLNANNNIDEILDIIKALLANHHKLDDSIIKKLKNMILFVSGSRYGNFSGSETLKCRKEIIEKWEVRDNFQLAQFTKELIVELDKSIKLNRADEEISTLIQ